MSCLFLTPFVSFLTLKYLIALNYHITALSKKKKQQQQSRIIKLKANLCQRNICPPICLRDLINTACG